MKVAIWKTTWLAPSETFIRNQVGSITRWLPVPLGIRRITSSLSDPGDNVVYENVPLAGLRAWVLEKTGFSIRLRKHVRRMAPDLIHAHFASGGMIVRRTARSLGVPLAVTLHGKDITAGPRQAGLSGRYYRFKLRRLFRDTGVVIAVSRHLADLAVALGAEPQRVVVHHIGIPIRDGARRDTVSRRIVAIGRMTEKKGFGHLIRAVALLPAELRDVDVMIVGDGPLRQELGDLAASLDVNVDFTGFQPSETVQEYLRARPLVCIPSVMASNGDEEGLPTVAMEASAEACAVVAYSHSGLPDVIDDGRTGLLVPEGDIQALSAALARLLNAPDQMDSMGLAGLEKVRGEFSILTQTELLERIYDRASAAPASSTTSPTNHVEALE